MSERKKRSMTNSKNEKVSAGRGTLNNKTGKQKIQKRNTRTGIGIL
mgnify:CR=1 FL=1